MAKQTIIVGNTVNDGTGDIARNAFIKTNQNFDELYAPTRLDFSNNAVSASFRNPGNGNLSMFVGASGATDGSQKLIFTTDKTSGSTFFAYTIAAPYVQVSPGATSNGYYVMQDWVMFNDVSRTTYTGLKVFQVSNGVMGIEGANQSNVKLPIILNPYGGNVGLGTTTPSAPLDIQTKTDGFNALMVRAVGGSKYLTIKPEVVTDVCQMFYWQGSTIGKLQVAGLEFGSGPTFQTDNTLNIGSASFRAGVIYAGTGTINTSDATMKALRDGTPIGLNYKVSSLEQSELNAAVKIADEIGVYKWQDAIAAKGEDARLHIGLTVQRAMEIMESEGLDPFSYGFICKDDITKKIKKKVKKKVQKTETKEEVYTEIEIINGTPTQVEKTRTTEVAVTELVDIVNSKGEKVMDGEGNVQQHPVPVMVTKTIEEEVEVPDGVRYGFRYDQLSMFVIKGLAEKIKAV